MNANIGQCPLASTDLQGTFDANRVYGDWFEYVYTPRFTDGKTYDCSMWEFTPAVNAFFPEDWKIINTLYYMKDREEDETVYLMFDFEWAINNLPHGSYKRGRNMN